MERILQRLTDLDEVIGAILVGKDGLIVSGTLHNEDEEILGAIAAATFGSINDFTKQIKNGEMEHAIIETQQGTIQFAEVGDLILIVLTKKPCNMGRVRIEMKKTGHQLLEVVAG